MQLTIEDTENIAEKLRFYDVEQAGWEHEGKGTLTNVHHVLLHVVKDFTGLSKPLDDSEIVRGALAPYNLQYGLRLGRWTDNSVEDLLTTGSIYKEEFAEEETKTGRLNLSKLVTRTAIAKLSVVLHDIDHKKTHDNASAELPQVARMAGGLLLYSAALQADHYKFSLEKAFDDRMHTLRERFNIPQPN